MNELITIMVLIALACLACGLLLSIGYNSGRVHEAKTLDEHNETQRVKIHSLTNRGKPTK